MKLEKMKLMRIYPNEEFKEITIADKLKLRYAISNKGRLMSFVEDIKFGRELKGSLTDGYRLFRYKIYKDGKIKNKHLFFYKLVAEHFNPKTSEEQVCILHLDRKRDNDDYRNLRWATKEEMEEHRSKSPFVIQAKKDLVQHNLNSNGRKLTVTKVMLIKKLLAKPQQTTRLKMIAKQFGVSEMQIRRIKTGENWSQVKI